MLVMADVERTLPDHARCDTHKQYRLNCAQYENLIARSGQECEICGMSGVLMPQEKLYIDHDRTPWGVRGLLCLRCNTVLGQTRDQRARGQPYLANSWWRTQCAALGLPAEPAPEPVIGSAIRNQLGTVWIRNSGEHWEAPSQDGHHPSPKSWRDLYWSFGAHNLVPYDLRGGYEDQTLSIEVRHVIETGSGWSDVRSVLGVPEPKPRKPYSRVAEWNPRDSLPWLQTPERTVRALRGFLTPEECRRVAVLLSQEESNTGQIAIALTDDLSD